MSGSTLHGDLGKPVARVACFEVQVYLKDFDPDEIRLKLYADRVMGNAPIRQEMKRVRQVAGALGGYVYSAAVSTANLSTDYTVRASPNYPGAAVPLENAQILWQR